ncbi:MAG: SDR family NAD(P)-dependent oxidoreductase [Caulobacteraceae bacterium]
MGRLDGKGAIVTGAPSGIGRASAKLFADEGASVLCFDKAEAVTETAAAGVTAPALPAPLNERSALAFEMAVRDSECALGARK